MFISYIQNLVQNVGFYSPEWPEGAILRWTWARTSPLEPSQAYCNHAVRHICATQRGGKVSSRCCALLSMPPWAPRAGPLRWLTLVRFGDVRRMGRKQAEGILGGWSWKCEWADREWEMGLGSAPPIEVAALLGVWENFFPCPRVLQQHPQTCDGFSTSMPAYLLQHKIGFPCPTCSLSAFSHVNLSEHWDLLSWSFFLSFPPLATQWRWSSWFAVKPVLF